jgi:hypothetical protein
MCRYCAVSGPLIEQADRAFARPQVHVPHRRREVLVAREILDRLRRRRFFVSASHRASVIRTTRPRPPLGLSTMPFQSLTSTLSYRRRRSTSAAQGDGA